MSTWISESHARLRAALFVMTAVLAGCAGLPDIAAGGFGLSGRAVERAALAGGEVLIAGPPGFCVDRSTIRDDESGAFVLLGSCASISNSTRAPAPAVPAVLTVPVSPRSGSAISAAIDGLEPYFASEAGLAALARDGRAASVEVLDTRREGGAFYIRLRDTSGTHGDLQQVYWRGLFDVNGRIVTISVTGFANRPISSQAGLALLETFAARIRSESRTAGQTGGEANKEA
jgi:hypothetical protein